LHRGINDIETAKSISLEVYMATLQQRIAEKFLTKLAESNQVDAERIGQLRKLLADGKKLKADDLVKIFSLGPGGDLK
jgi:hypothetical protein